MNASRPRGFTLIELLVSVAVIALLTAIVVVGITNARERSRDARRMSDAREIAKALAIYEASRNGYPVYSGDITGDDALSTALEDDGAISGTPTDPNSATPYTYDSADGRTYSIGFCLETDTIPGFDPGCDNSLTP